jgi:hypothetical protein
VLGVSVVDREDDREDLDLVDRNGYSPFEQPQPLTVTEGESTREMVQYFNVGHVMGHWHETGFLSKLMPQLEDGIENL